MRFSKLILVLISAGAAGVNAAAGERDRTLPENPPDGGIAGACGGNNSCFVAHPTPGCANFDCCNAVCAQDPFCCEQEWDNFCVGTANQICTGCGGAGVGDCFNDHSTPGCFDIECCELVCAQDPFCCETQWDNFCVGAADNLCTCGGLLTGNCFEVHPAPWCNDSVCCNIVCDLDPSCCDTTWDSNCAALANVACVCGGAYAGSCFKVHESSSPWCDREACCTEICAADPFCCQVQWDNFCVSSAYQTCCPGDVYPYFGNGVVDIDDLFSVIAAWGSCFNCSADVAPIGGNNQINIDDLFFVISQWGACE